MGDDDGREPVYPKTDGACYVIGGTHGSLTVPSLAVWRNPSKRSWWEPLETEKAAYIEEDPLALQIRQFCKVIGGEERPLVSGREGLQTLKVIDAVKRSARSGERILLSSRQIAQTADGLYSQLHQFFRIHRTRRHNEKGGRSRPAP